jgi:D-alanine-D-alanine ligase
VPVPQGQLVERLDQITLPLPLFIKPNTLGSSVGSSPVYKKEELEPALQHALRFDGLALVERFIKGLELTVSVLDDEALPIVEIRPHEGLYDYTNKYTKGCTDYFCPARISADITAIIQKQAVAANRAVGRTIYSRVDFLLEEDGNPWCLEINTIPGMTATSLLPKAAAAAGISFPQLCRRIIELSWAARRREGGA